jgi:hypothetical protein
MLSRNLSVMRLWLHNFGGKNFEHFPNYNRFFSAFSNFYRVVDPDWIRSRSVSSFFFAQFRSRCGSRLGMSTFRLHPYTARLSCRWRIFASPVASWRFATSAFFSSIFNTAQLLGSPTWSNAPPPPAFSPWGCLGAHVADPLVLYSLICIPQG